MDKSINPEEQSLNAPPREDRRCRLSPLHRSKSLVEDMLGERAPSLAMAPSHWPGIDSHCDLDQSSEKAPVQGNHQGSELKSKISGGRNAEGDCQWIRQMLWQKSRTHELQEGSFGPGSQQQSHQDKPKLQQQEQPIHPCFSDNLWRSPHTPFQHLITRHQSRWELEAFEGGSSESIGSAGLLLKQDSSSPGLSTNLNLNRLSWGNQQQQHPQQPEPKRRFSDSADSPMAFHPLYSACDGGAAQSSLIASAESISQLDLGDLLSPQLQAMLPPRMNISPAIRGANKCSRDIVRASSRDGQSGLRVACGPQRLSCCSPFLNRSSHSSNCGQCEGSKPQHILQLLQRPPPAMALRPLRSHSLTPSSSALCSSNAAASSSPSMNMGNTAPPASSKVATGKGDHQMWKNVDYEPHNQLATVLKARSNSFTFVKENSPSTAMCRIHGDGRVNHVPSSSRSLSLTECAVPVVSETLSSPLPTLMSSPLSFSSESMPASAASGLLSLPRHYGFFQEGPYEGSTEFSLIGLNSSTISTQLAAEDEKIDEIIQTLSEGSGMKGIKEWLKSLRLHKYTRLILDMTYEELLELSDEGLEKRGVTLGARGKILKNIQLMKERPLALRELSLAVEKVSRASSERDMRELIKILFELEGILLMPLKPYQSMKDPLSSTFKEPPKNPLNLQVASDQGQEDLQLREHTFNEGVATQLLDTAKAGNESQEQLQIQAHQGPVAAKDMATENVPQLIFNLLQKIFMVIFLSELANHEVVTVFACLLNRCLNREAFSSAQKQKIASWLLKMKTLWNPPSIQKANDYRRRSFRGCELAGKRLSCRSGSITGSSFIHPGQTKLQQAAPEVGGMPYSTSNAFSKMKRHSYQEEHRSHVVPGRNPFDYLDSMLMPPPSPSPLRCRFGSGAGSDMMSHLSLTAALSPRGSMQGASAGSGSLIAPSPSSTSLSSSSSLGNRRESNMSTDSGFLLSSMTDSRRTSEADSCMSSGACPGSISHSLQASSLNPDWLQPEVAGAAGFAPGFPAKGEFQDSWTEFAPSGGGPPSSFEGFLLHGSGARDRRRDSGMSTATDLTEFSLPPSRRSSEFFGAASHLVHVPEGTLQTKTVEEPTVVSRPCPQGSMQAFLLHGGGTLQLDQQQLEPLRPRTDSKGQQLPSGENLLLSDSLLEQDLHNLSLSVTKQALD